MSGYARDFNNMETRAVIIFSPLQGKAPKDIHAILIEISGEHAPSYATVKNWAVQFKRADFSTVVAPRPGRPKSYHPGDYWSNSELILEDRRISA